MNCLLEIGFGAVAMIVCGDNSRPRGVGEVPIFCCAFTSGRGLVFEKLYQTILCASGWINSSKMGRSGALYPIFGRNSSAAIAHPCRTTDPAKELGFSRYSRCSGRKARGEAGL